MTQLPITPSVAKIFKERFPNFYFTPNTQFFLAKTKEEETPWNSNSEYSGCISSVCIYLNQDELINVLGEKLRGEVFKFTTYVLG